MNYLKEILAFFYYKQIHGLSTGQIALWYALMDINNKCGWQEWFTVANSVLENLTGMTRQGIAKARTALEEKGLLLYKYNGTRASSYKLVSISKSLQGGIQVGMQGFVQDSLQDSLQVRCTLNKPNKTKQNKTYYSNTRKNKFNNYDDDNKTDYAALEEEILNMMLGE